MVMVAVRLVLKTGSNGVDLTIDIQGKMGIHKLSWLNRWDLYNLTIEIKQNYQHKSVFLIKIQNKWKIRHGMNKRKKCGTLIWKDFVTFLLSHGK